MKLSKESIQPESTVDKKPSRLMKATAILALGLTALSACGEKVSPADANNTQTTTEQGTTSSATSTPDLSSGSIDIPSTESTQNSDMGFYDPTISYIPQSKYGTDAYDALDPLKMDFVLFTPKDLSDGFDPDYLNQPDLTDAEYRKLLENMTNNDMCVLNDPRPEVVKECIEKTTGYNPDTSDDINTQSEWSNYKQVADMRDVVKAYMIKGERTLTAGYIQDGMIIVEYKEHGIDSLKRTSDSEGRAGFIIKDGEIVLSPSPQVEPIFKK